MNAMDVLAIVVINLGLLGLMFVVFCTDPTKPSR